MRAFPARMRRSRGVALVTVLLIVAVATVAGVALVEQVAFATRHTAVFLQDDALMTLAQAGNAWAAGVLDDDAQRGGVDHLGEDWAQPLPPTLVEGAQVSGAIVDLQSRFNLNNLSDGARVYEADRHAFERLLGRLHLGPELAAAVIDWIDADALPTLPGGAEDNDYLRLDPPYRAANRRLSSVSELRLVKGFDQNTVARLLPYVAVLPGHTAVNVNTAPREVLAALLENVSEADLDRIMAARQAHPFTTVEAFAALWERGDRHPDQGLALSVGSRYFQVTVAVHRGEASVRLRSTMERDARGKAVVRAIVRMPAAAEANSTNE